ncbi:MAG: type IV secretory system conjugative DNA transfer family protein [Bacilli bacterium]|jgi:type IV secretion system protein VirD4|nr:type IV secretory system conjugative DNA transfer family protein [Bacilli bacterium]
MKTKSTNLIIGELESGKTRGIMFPEVKSLIKEEKNLFIIDNKEEYYPRFKNELENNGYKVWLINLRNPLKSNTFNILEYPYSLYKNGNKDTAISLVTSIAENICINKSSESDMFWDNSAANYLTSLILILFEKGAENEINFMSLGALINMLDDPLKIEKLKDYFKTLDVINPIYRLGSPTIFAPIDTRGGILSTLKFKINSFFNREEILKTLSLKEFSINKYNEKTAIFFEGKSEINAIANILIGQLITITKEQDRELSLILDDFNSLPKISEIKELIEYASFNNLKSYFITNCFEELIDLYGKYTFNKITNIVNINEIDNLEIDNVMNKVEYPVKQDKNIKIIDINKI